MPAKVPLIDLKQQYTTLKQEILSAVEEVLNNGRYILGSNVKTLEEEIATYTGAKYGIGVANGTDALHLCLEAFNIGPGDEVITTPFTFFSSSEVISKVGATPVFVDIDPRTYNIDVESIEKHINEKTRAIIPVHIFGQPVDMDPLLEIAEKYSLIVIEDACQAIGAAYKHQKVGTLGHAACFSFFPTKNLGCYGDGGMVVTNNQDVAEKIKILRTHGSSTKYHHSMIGYNSRLDELQAAILRVKLPYLNKWNEARRQIAAGYRKLISSNYVSLPYESKDVYHVYHLFVIQSERRDAIINTLRNEGISTGIYYPVPLHLQKAYQSLGYSKGSLPNAELVCQRVLALPLYPEMSNEELNTVVEVINNLF